MMRGGSTTDGGKESDKVPGCRRQIHCPQLITFHHDHHVLTVKEDLEFVKVAV